jgi:hypothetical protein
VAHLIPSRYYRGLIKFYFNFENKVLDLIKKKYLCFCTETEGFELSQKLQCSIFGPNIKDGFRSWRMRKKMKKMTQKNIDHIGQKKFFKDILLYLGIAMIYIKNAF